LYGILVGRTYQDLRLFFQTSSDKLFLQGRYDYYKSLSDASSRVGQKLALPDILKVLYDTFDNVVEITNPRVFLPENFTDAAVVDEEGELLEFEELLLSPDDGPEALFQRNLLLDEMESALAELPDEQRDVFVAHEFEGRSFKELSEETGVSVSTLLARKRYAVLRLRERLQHIHDEFMRK